MLVEGHTTAQAARNKGHRLHLHTFAVEYIELVEFAYREYTMPMWLIRYRTKFVAVNHPPKLVAGRLHTSGIWIYLVGGGAVSTCGKVLQNKTNDIQLIAYPDLTHSRLADNHYELIERFPRWLQRI